MLAVWSSFPLILSIASLNTATKVARPAATVAGVIVGAANPAAHITLPIVLGLVLAKWVYDVYRAT